MTPYNKLRGDPTAIAAKEWFHQTDPSLHRMHMKGFAEMRGVPYSLLRNYLCKLKKGEPLPGTRRICKGSGTPPREEVSGPARSSPRTKPTPASQTSTSAEIIRRSERLSHRIAIGNLVDRPTHGGDGGSIAQLHGGQPEQRSLPSTSNVNSNFSTYITSGTPRMTCNICQWDAPYGLLSMYGHSRSCKGEARVGGTQRPSQPSRDREEHAARQAAFSRDSSVDELSRDQVERPVPNAPGPLVTRPGPPVRPFLNTSGLAARPPSVEEVSYQLLRSFDQIRAQRFVRIIAMKEQILKDWYQFWEEHQQWQAEVMAAVARIREDGFPAEAQRLAGALLSDQFDWGKCETIYQTPLGDEVITITGFPKSDEMRETAQQIAREHGAAYQAGAGASAATTSDHKAEPNQL